MDALEESGFDPAGKSALVFGTGGASKAVVFALKRLGAGPILLAGRDPSKTNRVSRALGAVAAPLDSLPDNTARVNLVVNATPVSSPGEGSELADLVARLHPADCELVVDLNYGRSANFWQDFARTRAVRFIDGLPMLAYQARRSFMLWTGVDVEAEMFMKALEESS